MDHSELVGTAGAAAVFGYWLDKFTDAVEHEDAEAFASQFDVDGYWKDLLSLTWDYKTFTGPAEIGHAFGVTAEGAKIRNIRVAAARTPPCFVRRSGRSLLEGYFEFDTAVGGAVGFVRLLFDQADPHRGKVWQLLTALHHLSGFAEKIGEHRPTGDKYSKLDSTESWIQKRERERGFADRDPEVVIIGAGQGGLMLGARLRQIGVDALLIERTSRVGDVWRNRYNNLTLHNELIANHFPYMPFPENWPVWLPKDMLAGWLEAYAECQELNVWTATTLAASRYDEDAGQWEITLRRADGTERTMFPKHLVAAVGLSGGAPRRAKLPGLSEFGGTVLHSAEFTSGAEWAGKRALVIGTGNSGHDIAQDLFAGGATVSMMQRGPTCVISLDPGARISYSVFGEGRHVDDVDLMIASIAYPVLIDTYRWITQRTEQLDRQKLDGLRAAGFKLTTGEDETGFQLLYLRGLGGYYIDVGCSQLIIDGKVALVQASDMDRFVTEGLRLRDGNVVPFELVVLATGFESVQESIRRMFGDAVADRVGPIWGFDEDRNMRNVWKRTAQPGFWVMGGAIIEARLFSRFLALQIKASLEGLMPAASALPLHRARPPQASDLAAEKVPVDASERML